MTNPDDDFDLEAFDAAFAREFGETLGDDPQGDPEDSQQGGPHSEPQRSAPDPDQPDQDASEEGGGAADEAPGTRRVIAMVLTPVADARVLARLMGLVKITWPVFATRTGAVAATTLPIDEMAALTGVPPQDAITVAQVLSRTSEFGVVLLTSRMSAGQEETTGQVQAWRYVGGQEVEELSPGVVLAGADEAVEDVIFGQVAPHEARGALDPAQVATQEDPEPHRHKRRWGRKPR